MAADEDPEPEDPEPEETPLESRLKFALMLAHAEFEELMRFAGTAEVLRPITRGQQFCRWDRPDWAEKIDAIANQIEAAEAE